MPRTASADDLTSSGAVPDETTALLRKPSTASALGGLGGLGSLGSLGGLGRDGEVDAAEAESIETRTPAHRRWLSEIWLLTKASVPVVLAYTLQNSLQTVSVMIDGRLSTEALATADYSYMFAL